MGRRRKRRFVWLGLFLAVLGMAVWAAAIEPGLLRVRTLALESPHWPSTHPPLRIAFLADLHVGAPHVSIERLDAIVTEANRAAPDIVLLGGDYVAHVLGRREVPPEAIARSLGKLKARHGIFAVMGNHDHWEGAIDRFKNAFQSVGIVVLENASHRLALPSGTIWIVGLGDGFTGRADPVKALRGVTFSLPMAEPVIVVAHDPGIFLEVPREAALIAAGHTHGGQVRVPFFGAIVNASRAPLRHSYGVIREHGKLMFVTSGIGTSILPIRFNAPPEIAILTIGPEPLKR